MSRSAGLSGLLLPLVSVNGLGLCRLVHLSEIAGVGSALGAIRNSISPYSSIMTSTAVDFPAYQAVLQHQVFAHCYVAGQQKLEMELALS